MKINFTAFNVRAELTDALRKRGITEPTPIQAGAIPLVMAGHDVIAQAQTGTGKTLAFVLPILEKVDPSKQHVQALIVTPTRELAIQITNELKLLAPLVGVRILAAYGGKDVEQQVRKLDGAVQVVIGTPGRLIDLLERNAVSFGKLSFLVLDEADQMLHMGFMSDIDALLSQMPSRKQTLLFSATMPQNVRNLAKKLMRNPQEVTIAGKQVTLDEIDQSVVRVNETDKADTLCQLIDESNPYLALVFCRTKTRADELTTTLAQRGYLVDVLHGDLSQAKREQVMRKFRSAKLQVLIATDLAARGLDIEGITHIYQYDAPHDAETYIHRIGRTARAGRRGMAITFATVQDIPNMDAIQKKIKSTLIKLKPGEGGDAQTRRSEGKAPERGSGGRRGANGAARGGRGGIGAKRDGSGRGGPARGADAAERGYGATAARGRGSSGAERGGPVNGADVAERGYGAAAARGRGSSGAERGGPARGADAAERGYGAARGGSGAARGGASGGRTSGSGWRGNGGGGRGSGGSGGTGPRRGKR